jgi:tetraacyldisaccharide 4'-kinase
MLERAWKRILRRRWPSFWSIPALALWIVSLGYGVGSRVNRLCKRSKVHLKVPVISIGNIAVGGSGKTPLVASLGRALIQEGYRVGIVSSGYRRTGVGQFVEVGHALSKRTADDTGDEVQLLARALPDAMFAVHPVKTEAARRLVERVEVDLIIVDDGFQHFGLHRDLDIVAFDAAVPRKWLRSFPYGILREPISTLRLADVVVITRSNFAVDISGLKARVSKYAPNAVWYDAKYLANQLVGESRRLPVKYLEDKSVLLFAGVGHFDSLHRQVTALAGTLVEAVELSDHQQYDEPTVTRLQKLIKSHSPDVVLTTGKDWVKARHFDFGGEFYYLDLAIDLNPGEEHLTALVQDRLGLKRRDD